MVQLPVNPFWSIPFQLQHSLKYWRGVARICYRHISNLTVFISKVQYPWESRPCRAIKTGSLRVSIMLSLPDPMNPSTCEQSFCLWRWSPLHLYHLYLSDPIAHQTAKPIIFDWLNFTLPIRVGLIFYPAACSDQRVVVAFTTWRQPGDPDICYQTDKNSICFTKCVIGVVKQRWCKHSVWSVWGHG